MCNCGQGWGEWGSTVSETTLSVHPHCLMFFVDETGHERFADPNHPVFGMGGCAIMAGAIPEVIRRPWRSMKAEHFGGADSPLHASDLRNPTRAQLEALSHFFSTQRFGRFAVTMNRDSRIPPDTHLYRLLGPVLRKRFEELASHCVPPPVEVAMVHEASERGDPLLERYFGGSHVAVEGRAVPVHHAIMPKGDECLEVADFIVHAAGGQARNPAGERRRDFSAVFHDPLLISFIHIDELRPTCA